ncbi:hypothetical protein [Xylanibacter rodentium]|uniref:hypothetical protein n=1 Tax=Xylanibacter rodentium TaxID=2736289 RepID=UPI0025873AB0|nr:hypothetical protein [Xylanibacter rodentium]
MASTTDNDADYKTALMASMALAGIREANSDKTRAPPELFYHGKRIISLDDVAAGLHITKKTIRKYRDEGIIEIYESRTCGAAFVTQEAFNDFIDSHFISSQHPDYPKLKKKQNKDGDNAVS